MDFPTKKDIAEYFMIDDGQITTFIEDLKNHKFSFIRKNQAPSPNLEEKAKEMYEQSNIIGVDIPIYIKGKSINCNKKPQTIIIIGQDPLRKIEEFNDCHKCIIGTPYALHMGEEYSKGRFCRLLVSVLTGTSNYNLTEIKKDLVNKVSDEIFDIIVNKIKDTTYNVYCTDFYKFYTAEINDNKEQISHIEFYKKDDTLKKEALSLLKKEIQKISEQESEIIIILFGKDAEAAYNNLKLVDLNIKTCILPHFSSHTNSWEPLIKDFIDKKTIDKINDEIRILYIKYLLDKISQSNLKE